MNESKKFRRLARWVKIRRWLITVGIAVIVVGAALPIAYKLTQMRAAKESNAIMQAMTLNQEIMAPNIQTSDQYLGNTSIMGGEVISHRYKEIEGYRVPWSTASGNYTWLGGGGDTLANATDWGDTADGGLYDRLTQQKIPLFYNTRVKKPEIKVTQAISQVARSQRAVAEMAITFKQPLTYQQIRAKLPAKLHAQWYWIGVDGQADSTMMDNNFLGLQVPSVKHSGRLTTADYQPFVAALREEGQASSGMSYDKFDLSKFARKYVKQHPTLRQAKFAGVIVTGNSEDFTALTQANWIYASSVGIFKPRTGIK